MSNAAEYLSPDAPTTVKDLLTRWQMRADHYREMAVEPAARALEECREELQALHHIVREAELTLDEAEEECGYSRDHLYRMTRQGKLNYVKRDGRILVRRCDLPRKGRPPYIATEREIFDEAI